MKEDDDGEVTGKEIIAEEITSLIKIIQNIPEFMKKTSEIFGDELLTF